MPESPEGKHSLFDVAVRGGVDVAIRAHIVGSGCTRSLACALASAFGNIGPMPSLSPVVRRRGGGESTGSPRAFTPRPTPEEGETVLSLMNANHGTTI